MDALLADGALPALLWNGVIRPLARLLPVMALSLTLAHLLEAFGWTAFIAKLSAPAVRLARLGPDAGAAFSLAFLSPAASNATLAQAFADGRITRRELMLANIFNSTPAFLTHLPSLLALSFSFLGAHACTYVGLTFLAATMRTGGVALAGRFLLPRTAAAPEKDARPGPARIRASLWPQLKRRILKICLFTAPVYCLVVLLQYAGFFNAVESFFTAGSGRLPFLPPAAAGVVAVHIAAESGAAFAAASALLHNGAITPAQAVTALLIGNILSSPMRAFRHQLPAYAGYFTPRLALALVAASQGLRAASLALVTIAYCLA